MASTSNKEDVCTVSNEKIERTEESSAKRQKLESEAPHPIGNPSVSTEQPQQQTRKKRKICDRCHRPVPQTCVCESLPATQISLSTTEVIVLQHPMELKHHKAASHRSLPLLELCLDATSLILKMGRRFGKESLGDEILSKLWGKDENSPSTIRYIPVLVFPKINVGTNESENERKETNRHRYCEGESTFLSLTGLVERWKQETNDASGEKVKILLLVLDATWRHAREMHLANIKNDQYPPHMLRLALEPDDFAGGFVSGRFCLRGKASKTGYKQQKSSGRKRNRGNGTNEETTEIDETWMSTAECIAWILSRLEECNRNETNDNTISLYEILMKPLDAMVAKWNAFRNRAKDGNSKKQDSRQRA